MNTIIDVVFLTTLYNNSECGFESARVKVKTCKKDDGEHLSNKPNNDGGNQNTAAH